MQLDMLRRSCRQGSSRNGSRPSVRCLAAAPGRMRPAYIPGRIDDPNYVRIFDTTLRDGEQSPGATMTSSVSALDAS